MKIYVDDLRNPENYNLRNYILARTVDAAIELLSTNKIEFASLDHDMGDGEKDGTYLINYIEENNLWPTEGVHVHSQNPVGRRNMEAAIKKHYGRTFNVPM